MLSKRCDIQEFFEQIRNKAADEIIHLANVEATETERHLYRDCRRQDCLQARQYAVQLKDFILFMRHGVFTRSTRRLDIEAFRPGNPSFCVTMTHIPARSKTMA